MNSGRGPSGQGNASSGCAIILSAGVFVGGGAGEIFGDRGGLGLFEIFQFPYFFRKS